MCNVSIVRSISRWWWWMAVLYLHTDFIGKCPNPDIQVSGNQMHETKTNQRLVTNYMYLKPKWTRGLWRTTYMWNQSEPGACDDLTTYIWNQSEPGACDKLHISETKVNQGLVTIELHVSETKVNQELVTNYMYLKPGEAGACDDWTTCIWNQVKQGLVTNYMYLKPKWIRGLWRTTCIWNQVKQWLVTSYMYLSYQSSLGPVINQIPLIWPTFENYVILKFMCCGHNFSQSQATT